jgi:OmcA/MtrC family decaheme c-type cytochrome
VPKTRRREAAVGGDADVMRVTRVDANGSSVEIDFDVIDEEGDPVDILLATDGRFTIDRLDVGVADGLGEGDTSRWVNLGSRASSAERFTSGTFDSPSTGSYTYTSVFDPSTVVSTGDTIRVAIQLAASDLPAENAWCDFVAPATDCSGSAKKRDIVQTADCNSCHGPTDDTMLAFHGGGRTDVEYCVTCHNPDLGDDGDADMTVMIHKIHTGKDLQNGLVIYGFGPTVHDFGSVGFTGNMANCKTCHDDLTYPDDDDISSYSTEAASLTLPTTIDTGADAGNPSDDLNISSIASVCSSCHDSDVARNHMEQNGASFIALDKDIH